MSLKKRAAGYFQSHPTATEFHFTSDGMAFFEDHTAESHARTLADRTVTLIKKEEVEGMNPDEEEDEQEQGAGNPDAANNANATKGAATGKAPAKKATPTK